VVRIAGAVVGVRAVADVDVLEVVVDVAVAAADTVGMVVGAAEDAETSPRISTGSLTGRHGLEAAMRVAAFYRRDELGADPPRLAPRKRGCWCRGLVAGGANLGTDQGKKAPGPPAW